MTITDHEMKRRALVAHLRSRITDVIGEFVGEPDGITYVECLKALHEAMGTLVGDLIVDEWRERS
jgi:hypothetical protein